MHHSRRAFSFRFAGQIERRMCHLKRAFETCEQARRENAGQRPYHCPVCGRWHLASRR